MPPPRSVGGRDQAGHGRWHCPAGDHDALVTDAMASGHCCRSHIAAAGFRSPMPELVFAQARGRARGAAGGAAFPGSSRRRGPLVATAPGAGAGGGHPRSPDRDYAAIGVMRLVEDRVLGAQLVPPSAGSSSATAAPGRTRSGRATEPRAAARRRAPASRTYEVAAGLGDVGKLRSSGAGLVRVAAAERGLKPCRELRRAPRGPRTPWATRRRGAGERPGHPADPSHAVLQAPQRGRAELPEEHPRRRRSLAGPTRLTASPTPSASRANRRPRRPGGGRRRSPPSTSATEGPRGPAHGSGRGAGLGS